METRAPYILVGGFVVLVVVGLVIAVLWFAQVQFNQQVSYYDIFLKGSVTGLTTGSTVRYNGVPVGRVSEIRLDPVDPNQVRVTVELTAPTVVKTDAVAALEQQGLTGGAFINITGGSRESPPLERQPGQRYPVIASRASGLQQVEEVAPEVLNRLIALTDRLNDLVNDHNRQALAETLENLRKISAVVASRSDEIDGAINDGSAALHDLRTTLDQANHILVHLNEAIPPAGQSQATLQSINDASRNFADMAKRLDAILAENQPQIRDFTRRGLDQLDQLVAQTQQLVAQLSRLADTLGRDPSRFLYGDRRQGYQPR